MIRDKVKAYCQQQCVMDGAFRQVYDEQKLDDCVKMLFKKASKLKEGNCAMVEDMTVYKWVRDFFYGDDTPVEDTVMAAEIYTDSQEDEEDIKSEDLEVVKVEKPAQKKEKKQKSDWMEGQPTLFDF